MILAAIKLAKMAHEGQVRRFTREDYIVHPARVATQVGFLDYATEEMVAAAWLHDVIEDTAFGYTDIEKATNRKVANLVLELTFDEDRHKDLSYASRKAIQNRHISATSFEAKSIKILDRLDNLADFAKGVLQGDCERDKLERYVRTSWQLQDLLVSASDKADDILLCHLQVTCIRLNRNYNLGIKNIPQGHANEQI